MVVTAAFNASSRIYFIEHFEIFSICVVQAHAISEPWSWILRLKVPPHSPQTIIPEKAYRAWYFPCPLRMPFSAARCSKSRICSFKNLTAYYSLVMILNEDLFWRIFGFMSAETAVCVGFWKRASPVYFSFFSISRTVEELHFPPFLVGTFLSRSSLQMECVLCPFMARLKIQRTISASCLSGIISPFSFFTYP